MSGRPSIIRSSISHHPSPITHLPSPISHLPSPIKVNYCSAVWPAKVAPLRKVIILPSNSSFSPQTPPTRKRRRHTVILQICSLFFELHINSNKKERLCIDQSTISFFTLHILPAVRTCTHLNTLSWMNVMDECHGWMVG
jgi:hypothetical protein